MTPVTRLAAVLALLGVLVALAVLDGLRDAAAEARGRPAPTAPATEPEARPLGIAPVVLLCAHIDPVSDLALAYLAEDRPGWTRRMAIALGALECAMLPEPVPVAVLAETHVEDSGRRALILRVRLMPPMPEVERWTYLVPREAARGS